VADEHIVLDRHALADEGVAGDLAPPADGGVLLDLDERPEPGVVADLAAVEVDEAVDGDVPAEPHVRGDADAAGRVGPPMWGHGSPRWPRTAGPGGRSARPGP